MVSALTLTLVAAACGVGDRAAPKPRPIEVRQSAIFSGDGTEITKIEAVEKRETVSLAQIPTILQNAVVAIEDERFWDHNGVDLRAIARAATENISEGGVSEGGSTITQQYVKNTLLGSQQTISRKIEEASLALQIEKTHSKQFILEQYLNTIYFGNRAYGAQMAAKRYFGMDVGELDASRAATLAGLIQQPSRFDPYRNLAGATTRRNLVLDAMLDQGYLTQRQYDEATAQILLEQVIPLEEAQAPNTYPAAHFVDEVKRFIRTNDAFGESAADREELLVEGGLQIFTTIDLGMQEKAEQAIAQTYPDQDRPITDRRKDPDVGLVSIDPKTGYVKAMVGGYDYWDTDFETHPYAQVNLAAGGGRQMGSAMKPIALIAALRNGIEMSDRFSAPGKATVKIDGFEAWEVKGASLGKAALSTCTYKSANTCFANLIADERVLPQGFTDAASLVGIDTGGSWKTVPSAVLGANNTTVFDLAGAYGTFANRGVYVPPAIVTKVISADGTVLYQHAHTQRKVLEPNEADDVIAAMEKVFTSGTATGRGIGRPAAGKTGTTQDSTDAAFYGYTPDLVTGVWAGFAQLTPDGDLRRIGMTGARGAAPVWQRFMNSALEGTPPTPWPTGEEVNGTTTTTTTIPPINDEIFELEGEPRLVSMPDMDGRNTNEAASLARRQGLRLRRINIEGDHPIPGQVLAQSPPAGKAIPIGSTVVVEATPGNPPPKEPLPDVLGQPGTGAVENLRGIGWTITAEERRAPNTPYKLPNGDWLLPGHIWQMTPEAGTVVEDGKVTVYIQPGDAPMPPTTTTTAPP